jgi:hypothetical protein
MKRIILLIFSIGLLANFECDAQSGFRNGFIITIGNDTIYGQVDYRTNARNYQSCIFKNDNEIKEYSPQQINGFGYVNDKYFSSKIIEGSFVEALVMGELSLYKFKSFFLIRKNEGEIFKLETKEKSSYVDGVQLIIEDNKWKGIISYLIFDCFPNSNILVRDMRLEEKDLTQLILKYNGCKQSDFKDFKKNRPWYKIDLGASIGLIRSSIDINNESGQFSYLANLYTSFDPTFGLILASSSPRISERLAIQSEVYITKSSYSGLVKLPGSTTRFYDTYINLTTVSVPISIKYSVPVKKYFLCVQGGINYEYNVRTNTRLLSEIVYNHVVNTLPETTAFEIKKSLLGFWGGVGILKSFNRFKASANIRYYQMANMNEYIGLSAKLNRIGLSIIIYKK